MLHSLLACHRKHHGLNQDEKALYAKKQQQPSAQHC
jgi:hypothetical protein